MKKFLKKVFSIETQLKIERFFTEILWQMLIVFAFIFICAWIFDKYIEAVLFCISHTVIRMIFEKQYHCGKTYLCLFLTLTIAFFGIMYTFPLALSLLSAIPICWVISWIGYIAQDRLDLKAKKERTLFQLPKDELLSLMNNSTLSLEEKDAIQYKVIDKLKGEYFYNAMGYSKRQSLRIYKSAVAKLNNLIQH